MGSIVGFFIELMVVSTGEKFSGGERAANIALWPIMVLIFIVSFIKGFFDQ